MHLKLLGIGLSWNVQSKALNTPHSIKSLQCIYLDDRPYTLDRISMVQNSSISWERSLGFITFIQHAKLYLNWISTEIYLRRWNLLKSANCLECNWLILFNSIDQKWCDGKKPWNEKCIGCCQTLSNGVRTFSE